MSFLANRHPTDRPFDPNSGWRYRCSMCAYEIGKAEIDSAIAELVTAASAHPNDDLIREIVTTALKLHRDNPDRGELKLVNTALKEMRYSMLTFSRFGEKPKVTMYGSARIPPDHIEYKTAKQFAEIMAHERGWEVITGAGPGIMQAGNEGAGLDHSYGVNIRLPFESDANSHIRPERTVNFKYFFTRKLGFVKESSAFALFPGGFGTMDEAFELLTLVQTGKSDMHPIVLVESGESSYWTSWNEFVNEELVTAELISPEDVHLYRHFTDPVDAAEEVCRFYANYQSQRYVNGNLVIRLAEQPSAIQLQQLNDEFSDIVVSGSITAIDPTAPEIRDEDHLDSARIHFHFDRRHYGRLRLLIDRVNSWVSTPTVVHPGDPFTSEQQDRPW